MNKLHKEYNMTADVIKFIRKAEQVSFEELDPTHHMMTVNDQSTIVTSRSGIGRMIKMTNVENVEKMLVGGHFLFQGDELKEYRDGNYTGFIHDNDWINRFSNTPELLSHIKSVIEIPDFGDGGKFDLNTGFTWSAFNPFLKTQVNLMRLICANGMRVKHKLFEKKVPLINNFEKHLDISAEQINITANKEIKTKLFGMNDIIASVRDVALVGDHIQKRLEVDPLSERLNGLNEVILAGEFDEKYTPYALNSASITSHLPSHLSRFDLLNITTELMTHTKSVDRSTDNALNLISTNLIFSDNEVNQFSKAKIPRTFSNPEQAFFGVS